MNETIEKSKWEFETIDNFGPKQQWERSTMFLNLYVTENFDHTFRAEIYSDGFCLHTKYEYTDVELAKSEVVQEARKLLLEDLQELGE